MTITINGNGTIGGVSVGGLPDGIVDTDMLASAAVTSAKVGTLADSNMPAGSVLQVVSSYTTTQVSTTSSTFSDTGLSASITPSSSSNKILVLTNNNGNYTSGGSTDAGMKFQLLRDGSVLHRIEDLNGYLDATTSHSGASSSTCYLDSPSTTSSVTYKTQFNSRNNGSTVFANFGSSLSTITLMEIAG